MPASADSRTLSHERRAVAQRQQQTGTMLH
jgi:hypothetical protein